MKKNKIIFLGTLSTLSTIPFVAASCNVDKTNEVKPNKPVETNPSTEKETQPTQPKDTTNEPGKVEKDKDKAEPNKDSKVENKENDTDKKEDNAVQPKEGESLNPKTEEERKEEEYTEFKKANVEPKLTEANLILEELKTRDYLTVEQTMFEKIVKEPLVKFNELKVADDKIKTNIQNFLNDNYSTLTTFFRNEKTKWEGIVNLKSDDTEYPKYVKNIKLGVNKLSTKFMELLRLTIFSMNKENGINQEQFGELQNIFRELQNSHLLNRYNDLFFEDRRDLETEPEVAKTQASQLGSKEDIKTLYNDINSFINTNIGKFNEIMAKNDKTMDLRVNAQDYILDPWNI